MRRCRWTRESVRGITHLGGTILGTTNRGNPFDWPVREADGTVRTVDRSDELIEAFRQPRLRRLIAIGGDGSLHIANELAKKGLPVVGVPKTIDNDLAATQVTFGFHTAVQTASEALDKLHSTAESHERVMVVELMGRHTGWIALFAGVSATADVILIPEIPYRIDSVCEKIRDREAEGRHFSIVVVAEGARPVEGDVALLEEARPGAAARYGGIAERWRPRSSAVRARRPGPWCSATSSAAAPPSPMTASSRSGSAPRPCAASRRGPSAPWWPWNRPRCGLYLSRRPLPS
jgi:ATP-dependent phosphofructokinase / diphosphate-dependent phosphofructokinase